MSFIRINNLRIIILHGAFQRVIILQMHMSMHHIFWLILVQQFQKNFISLMCMIIAIAQSLSRCMSQQNIEAMIENQLVFDM